mmetsp:Transcript_32291/g.106568  ORF Transcript_32291/g.106568 Transcript_32291/m.106568 type:complete len:257 (+) Transcript_32291:1888-2658(+)
MQTPRGEPEGLRDAVRDPDHQEVRREFAKDSEPVAAHRRQHQARLPAPLHPHEPGVHDEQGGHDGDTPGGGAALLGALQRKAEEGEEAGEAGRPAASHQDICGGGPGGKRVPSHEPRRAPRHQLLLRVEGREGRSVASRCCPLGLEPRIEDAPHLLLVHNPIPSRRTLLLWQVTEMPPAAAIRRGTGQLQNTLVVVPQHWPVGDGQACDAKLLGHFEESPLQALPNGAGALVQDGEARPMVQQPPDAQRLLLAQRE